MYTLLLSWLHDEYASFALTWSYQWYENTTEGISSLLLSIIEIVEDGYLEGGQQLLDFCEYVCRWNGKCDGEIE